MKIKKTICILLVVFCLINIIFINAKKVRAYEDPEETTIFQNLETTAETNAGYASVTKNSPRDIVANIIKIILSFLGIVFLILIIVSGYQWMTAGGNDEIIGKAKKRIINATIGLAIVILSYSISFFIMWVIYGSSGVTY